MPEQQESEQLKREVARRARLTEERKNQVLPEKWRTRDYLTVDELQRIPLEERERYLRERNREVRARRGW